MAKKIGRDLQLCERAEISFHSTVAVPLTLPTVPNILAEVLRGHSCITISRGLQWNLEDGIASIRWRRLVSTRKGDWP